MELLARGDYAGYDAHCLEAKSDARDAGQVFRYLRGELSGEILDMTYTDASELYEAPPPDLGGRPPGRVAPRLAARRVGSDRLRVGSSGRRERRSGQEETHGRS